MSSLSQPLSILGSIAFFPWPLVMWYQVKKCEKPEHQVLRTLGTATRSWYDREPRVEVRRSAPLVVAEVEIPKKGSSSTSTSTSEEGAMRDALSRGFRQIASYIFGRNMGGGGGEGEGDQNAAAESDPRFLDGSAMGGGTGEKIAMTSPVVTQMPPLSSSASEASASALSATETAKGYVVAFVMPGSKYKSAAELPRPANPNVKLRDVPSKVSAVLGWRGGPRADEKMVAERRRELDEALSKAGIKPVASAGTTLNQYYPPFAPAWQRLCEISVDVDEATVGAEEKVAAAATE